MCYYLCVLRWLMRPILALNCLLQIEQERSKEESSVGNALDLAFRGARFCLASLILFALYSPAPLFMRPHHFVRSCVICSHEAFSEPPKPTLGHRGPSTYCQKALNTTCKFKYWPWLWSGYLQNSYPGFDWFAATIFMIFNGNEKKSWEFLHNFSTLGASGYLWLPRLHASVSHRIFT